MMIEALGDLHAFISGMPLGLFFSTCLLISPHKWTALTQSQRQRSTDGGAAEVMKGGDDVAQSKNK